MKAGEIVDMNSVEALLAAADAKKGDAAPISPIGEHFRYSTPPPRAESSEVECPETEVKRVARQSHAVDTSIELADDGLAQLSPSNSSPTHGQSPSHK